MKANRREFNAALQEYVKAERKGIANACIAKLKHPNTKGTPQHLTLNPLRQAKKAMLKALKQAG